MAMANKRKASTAVLETDDSYSKPKKARSTPYTSQQKTAIAEFASVTQADKTSAAKYLKSTNWNVGAAVNAYYGSAAAARPNPLHATLNKTFDRYRDDPKESPDEIGMEGTMQLCSEVGVDLEDIGSLVFFELVQSPSLGLITREGFVDGWTETGTDALAKMRNIILQRRSQLPTDRELFKKVYNHTFSLALQERQKALPLETATEMWRVLFGENGLQWKTANTHWLDWWIEYNEEKVKKAVNKDLWKQTLNFAQQSIKDESLSFWSEESSWPSVIDEFVEYVKTEKRAGGGDAMEIS